MAMIRTQNSSTAVL